MSVAGSGRCTWYRSIQSVWSRRRLSSTAVVSQWRELPSLPGRPAIGKWPLVAQHDLTVPLRQRPPDNHLRLAVGVHVRGVDEIDSGIEGGVHDAGAVPGVAVAHGAEHHRAQPEDADMHPGPAERSKTHQRPPAVVAKRMSGGNVSAGARSRSTV